MAIPHVKKGAGGVICSVAAIISIVLSSGNVRTNKEGLELIGNAEGCRRNPYVCPAGVLTDGLGNTHGVVPGTTKTDMQIAQDWEKNILSAERCVDQFANGKHLPSDIFSAAVSLTFRVGCGTVKKSTLFSFLRTSPLFYKAACNQFPRWIYANKIILDGLVIRADKEKNLCMKGVPDYDK